MKRCKKLEEGTYEGEKPSPEELIQYLVGEMLCMEEKRVKKYNRNRRWL